MSPQLLSAKGASSSLASNLKPPTRWLRGEARIYIAYAEPFHLDEDKHELTHMVFISLFPNWAGPTQPRIIRVEDDCEVLSTEPNRVFRQNPKFLSGMAARRRLLVIIALRALTVPAKLPGRGSASHQVV
ncbi:lipocalin-like domain-containing protein [Novosphingobium sp. TCA1]|uniref:lipocalin-like domain-containing protein n=1 Tax=Novosphingobium sp. TCA1 TaxID=2682474 RepID=UPI001308BDC0|nr:lipocalin-like domain-containing protein [Novosphingobium sp. TCA1]GFE76916.1 hypothetical protein NTCA1_45650 [Novosphingobium sp. TCA1]